MLWIEDAPRHSGDDELQDVVRLRSKSAFAALLLSGSAFLTLAACGQSPAATHGTVTGLASPCIGTANAGFDYRLFRYTISIEKGFRTIAQQELRGDTASTYRFVVPAGRYRIMNYPGVVDVTVRAGQTIHVNLLEPCG